MAANGRSLTAAQERLITALLTSGTLQAASEAAGVPYRTAWRWMEQEEFSAEYRRRIDSLVESACGAMKQSLSEAVEALREIVNNSQAPPAARISAARALLENGLRYTEMVDIVRRLEAVENATRES